MQHVRSCPNDLDRLLPPAAETEHEEALHLRKDDQVVQPQRIAAGPVLDETEQLGPDETTDIPEGIDLHDAGRNTSVMQAQTDPHVIVIQAPNRSMARLLGTSHNTYDT